MNKFCVDCGKIIYPKSIRCHPCAAKWWRRHPGKKLIRPETTCMDCNIIIKGYGIRCPSCAQKYKWQNENLRKQIINALKSRAQDINVRMKHRQATKALFQNPEYKLKHKISMNTPRAKSIKSQLSKSRWNDPKWRAKQEEIFNREERRAKLSMAMIKKWNDPKWRAKQETIYERLNYREKFSGPNNPNWRNGESRKPYGKGFTISLRKKIRQRDKYICQLCGINENGRKLDVHHIDYDKNNNSPNNLISLCASCHIKTSHNRNYWREYFIVNFQLINS